VRKIKKPKIARKRGRSMKAVGGVSATLLTTPVNVGWIAAGVPRKLPIRHSASAGKGTGGESEKEMEILGEHRVGGLGGPGG